MADGGVKDELQVAHDALVRHSKHMKRLLFLIAVLPAACSPPAEKTSEMNGAAGDTAPVPYAMIDWKEDVHYLNGKPFTGVTVQYHKNGKLSSRYTMKDGVYHGLVEEWHGNGQQKTKTNFANGKHEGDNFYWNPDGTLQVHKVWKDNHLVSETPGPVKP